jgi:hypothetical protein
MEKELARPMETIRDRTWMRQLALSTVERFELRGFRIALLSIAPTASHHSERFRYRLLAFDPALGKPVLSVDLENDILGDYCLSVETGQLRSILARFESIPSLEEFRARAVAEAEGRLP